MLYNTVTFLNLTSPLMGPLQTVDLIDVGYCMFMYVPVNAEKISNQYMLLLRKPFNKLLYVSEFTMPFSFSYKGELLFLHFQQV